ncbi:heme/hemin ABC transporter substrate-binding protein [Aestuariivirga sp.]|uniref:heme/hemin ABC transporter substrate-binding protein n=1 Tax=Aestuariivirga sp. TaxID=2650926 RepID=UPI0039E533CD
MSSPSVLSRRHVVSAILSIPALSVAARAGTITDFSGQPVTATGVERIVSIGSSVTEIIVDLGAAKKIVALDTTSVAVPGAQGLPDIGYLRTLSAEGVLSQSPQLICATNEAGPPGVIDTLKQSGIPFAIIPHVPTVEGILSKIALIGKLLDAEKEAATLAADVQQRALALKERVAKFAGARPKALFILSLADGRLLAGGAATGADSVITMAGGENVACSINGYKPLSTEFLLENPPDAVIMMGGTGLAPKVDEVFQNPALAQSPAARNKALRVFDGAALLGFGPRTIAQAEDLADFLHKGSPA